MKLVILGAGASYDAFYWYRDENTFKNWRAPLANEIFEQRPDFLNIIDTYPGSHSVFSQIGTVGDIEAFFQERYENSVKHGNINVEKQLINLKFFLQHLFYQISEKLNYAGNSNLVKLITHIDDYIAKTKEDVLIISFNYDLLMERALCEHYYGKAKSDYDIGDYLLNKIKLIKPHGSCNWFRVSCINQDTITPRMSFSDYLFKNNFTQEYINRQLEKEFICAPYSAGSFHKGTNNNFYMFPQIHIPLKEKDEFTMPKEQEDYLNEYLPKVDEVLIVGWKGSEQHFNRKLKEHLGNKTLKIQVVNGPNHINPAIVLYNLKDSINTNNSSLFLDDYSLEGINGTKEFLTFLSENKQEGSLTSFLIKLEQGRTKSIFD